MASLTEGFHQCGLGSILENLLKVPPNQRPYAWEEGQVQDYFQDLDLAMKEEAQEYFMGTIVLVETNGAFEIADGQQRLATTAIALARIRDLLFELGEDKDAKQLKMNI